MGPRGGSAQPEGTVQTYAPSSLRGFCFIALRAQGGMTVQRSYSACVAGRVGAGGLCSSCRTACRLDLHGRSLIMVSCDRSAAAGSLAGGVARVGGSVVRGRRGQGRAAGGGGGADRRADGAGRGAGASPG